MTDATSTTTTAPPENQQTPTPAANTPEARTPSGEIIDQTKPVESKQADTSVGADGKLPTTTEAGAPETYTEFKAPEGQTLDAKLIAEATPIFKELGLSQEGAQKLIDVYSAKATGLAKDAMTLISEMRAGWRAEIAADPVIGTNMAKVKSNIGSALSAACSDPKMVADYKSAMDLTGAGDHPAIIRVINKLAEFVNEGTHVLGRGPSEHGQVANGIAHRPSAAEAMYPNLARKS